MTVNNLPFATTLINKTSLKTRGTIATAGTFGVRVSCPDPRGLISDPVTVTGQREFFLPAVRRNRLLSMRHTRKSLVSNEGGPEAHPLGFGLSLDKKHL